jgi:hypothetical protein
VLLLFLLVVVMMGVSQPGGHEQSTPQVQLSDQPRSA